MEDRVKIKKWFVWNSKTRGYAPTYEKACHLAAVMEKDTGRAAVVEPVYEIV